MVGEKPGTTEGLPSEWDLSRVGEIVEVFSPPSVDAVLVAQILPLRLHLFLDLLGTLQCRWELPSGGPWELPLSENQPFALGQAPAQATHIQ